MVKADELAVFGLPQNCFYEVILLFVPGLEVVFYKASRVTGIGIEAPESVVEVLFCNELAEVFHPL